jgi:F0F1-type ATP synthase membrane subunit a
MSATDNHPHSVRPASAAYFAFRIGLYVGLALSFTLICWIFVANRIPFLEPFDRERNMAATTVMGLFGLIPIMRYVNAPRSLAVSGLVGWAILSFTYRVLCAFFPRLSEIRTPTQVLMLGVLFYLITATVAWMLGLIWRIRQSDPPHSRPHS